MAIIAGPEHPPITIASAPGRSTVRVRPPESICVPTDGTGELSSQFPGALTTVEGVPVSAQVLVRYRAEVPGAYGDGVLVATTTSSPAGEWEVQGINAKHRYDISARHIGENDALQSNVSPFDLPRFRPNTVQVPIGVPLDVALPIIGGIGSVSASHVSGSYPSGVSLVGNRLQGAWPTGATGSYPVTFDLTDDEGTFTRVLNIELYLLPMKLVGSVPALIVGDPVSTTFTASGGEGPYTFAVTAGSLPAGLSLNGSTGEISGTPTTPGAYSFGITVTDVRSGTATKTFAGSVLTKHAYWRLNITAHNGNENTSIAELRMRDSSGSNVATGGTAFANTEYSSGYVVGYAFDGNAGTRWAANGTHPLPHQIGYIMAVPEVVVAIEIVIATVGDDAPRDFIVQSSDDGVSWTDEWSVTGSTGWGANEQRTFNRP